MNYLKNYNFRKSKIIIILIFCTSIIFINKFLFIKKSNKEIKKLKSLKPIRIKKNSSTAFKYLKAKYYNLIDFKYSFSFLYNMIKVEYNFGIFDEKKKIFFPSDLPLYEDLHIYCYFKFNINKIIVSLANIYNNEYFNCIEFFKINEKVEFGVKILKGKINKYFYLFQFTEIKFDLNKYININHNIFSPILIIKNYELLVKMIKNTNFQKKYRLKKRYIRYPLFNLKNNSFSGEGKWAFANIYNHYFCFCNGKNCFSRMSQTCKLYFYVYIIDNNRYVYKKTDYLFIDFIFKKFGNDDTYPIFKEMGKDNAAHFITENTEIYQKYCSNQKKCLKIIYMTHIRYILYGNFFEKCIY